MGRKIKVEALYNERPDVRLYVLALIELARQLQGEAAAEVPKQPEKGEERAS